MPPRLYHDSGDQLSLGSRQVQAAPHPMALAFSELGFAPFGF